MVWLGIIVGVFLAEYKIKAYFDQTLKFGQSVEKWKGHIILNKYYNEGVAFDRLKKYPKRVIGLTSVLITMLGGYLITLCSFSSQEKMKLRKLSLAFLLGGAISNLWDRVTKHHVVDYFSLSYKKIRHIVFNIADFCIFIGTFLFVLSYYWEKK